MFCILGGFFKILFHENGCKQWAIQVNTERNKCEQMNPHKTYKEIIKVNSFKFTEYFITNELQNFKYKQGLVYLASNN